MDIQKLQSILMARGIRVFDDDPVFILVALNEVLLEEMTKKHQQTFNEVDERVVGKLSAIVTQTVSQIAGKEAEARAATAITKMVMWMVGGGLAGIAMFSLGMSYGAVYTTWTTPAWIERGGLSSVLSSALLKTPIGGIGFIVIALTLVFLQKALANIIAEDNNEEIKPVMKSFVYAFAAAFAATGLWISFLVVFK